MSLSKRTRRTTHSGVRHREDAELNLVPLIDILSVMVAFLLVYSVDVEVIQTRRASRSRSRSRRRSQSSRSS